MDSTEKQKLIDEVNGSKMPEKVKQVCRDLLNTGDEDQFTRELGEFLDDLKERRKVAEEPK